MLWFASFCSATFVRFWLHHNDNVHVCWYFVLLDQSTISCYILGSYLYNIIAKCWATLLPRLLYTWKFTYKTSFSLLLLVSCFKMHWLIYYLIYDLKFRSVERKVGRGLASILCRKSGQHVSIDLYINLIAVFSECSPYIRMHFADVWKTWERQQFDCVY